MRDICYLFQDPVPVSDITEPVLFYYTLHIGTVVNVLSVTTEGRLLQTSTVLQTTGLDTVIRVRIGYLYECLAGFPDDCSKQVVEIHHPTALCLHHISTLLRSFIVSLVLYFESTGNVRHIVGCGILLLEYSSILRLHQFLSFVI